MASKVEYYVRVPEYNSAWVMFKHDAVPVRQLDGFRTSYNENDLGDSFETEEAAIEFVRRYAMPKHMFDRSEAKVIMRCIAYFDTTTMMNLEEDE